MKHIVRKPYWNYEKEEKWLNEMAAKGMALVDYSWCRYVFEQTTQGEYVYRIELLKHSAKHPESRAYIDFLESEMSVECVATYMRWIYLRKKSSEGAFEIYTDIDSEIAHNKRIYHFWVVLIFLEFFAGFGNIFMGLYLYITDPAAPLINLFTGIPVAVLGFFFLNLALPIRKRIKILKDKKILME